MDRWGIFVRFADVVGHSTYPCLLKTTMGTVIHNLGGTIHYNDHHKEFTIHANGSDIPSLVKDLLNDEQPPAEQLQPQDCEDVLPIPPKGKYGKVREYIQERARSDKDFKDFIETHSRVELCARLTKEFGWFVDDNSLGRNINRNR